MSQSGGKATFTSLDDGKTFPVQYNPREFTVDKALTWEESKTQGKSSNPLQFQKGAPMTASMELYFDTTADDPPGNVQSVWVDKLLSLTNAEVPPAQGEPAELSKLRPRAFEFTWGTFSMKCVIESINVTYIMFDATGNAIRARATVKLKEWISEDFAGGGSSGTWGSEKLQLVQVSGGQTVSQVADALGVDVRDLMADNGLTDGLADYTGQTLLARL